MLDAPEKSKWGVINEQKYQKELEIIPKRERMIADAYGAAPTADLRRGLEFIP